MRQAESLAVASGEELFELARRLYPLPRSLTGNGVRRTLDALGEWTPLERTEIPSGSEIYDWIVPPEWNVNAASITTARGERLVDWADSTLHLVGYSEPVSATLTGAELDERLHSLPDRPDLIPYKTSYFQRTWGFCLPHAVRETIDPDERYEVSIDATLDPRGSLSYGECVIPGSETGEREIVISTHICHPSLANDNVAGMVVAAGFARSLVPGRLRSDVRVLFAPAGVGVLCWLHRHETGLAKIHAGLVLACVGDPGPIQYKQSRRGDALIDRVAERVLARREGATVRPFVPWGVDERQFCSPGFDLPFGVLSRTPNGMYPQYHTSADDLGLLSPAALADSLAALHEIVQTLDANAVYERVEPHGEPQLSRHSIEGTMTPTLLAGGSTEREALFWMMNLADGRHDLLSIAERGGLTFETVLAAAQALIDAGILRDQAP